MIKNRSSVVDVAFRMKEEKVVPNEIIDGVPIIYALSCDRKYRPLVEKLLKEGADPRIESEKDDFVPILFYCHSDFVRMFSEKGCHCNYSLDVLVNNLKKCISSANWQRLVLLDNMGHIDLAEIIKDADYDYIDFSINILIGYLFHLYNKRTDVYDVSSHTTDVIEKYKCLISLLVKKGSKVSRKTVTTIFDYYLYELLDIVPVKENPKKLEDKDPVKVALFRPLLNNFRYGQMVGRIK